MAVAAILAFATVRTVSAQSDDRDWKLPVTGLTAVAGDDPGEMIISWDAHTQTTKTFLNYRVAWTPEGERFKSADRTNWNVYTTSNQHTVTGLDAGATYQVKVRTRYEGRQGSRWTDVVTGQSAVTPNTPATGQPTISGTAEVRETLTAETSSITDSNGLTNAVFSHQWVRGTDTDISGATNSAYVITSADAESKIKVRVSFTDDDGYAEALTSSATALVPANNQIQPRTPTDATLSDLDLERTTGGNTVYLSPKFDSATTAYAAWVPRHVDEITIQPRLNESNASYEIQDGTGVVLSDADTTEDDFQVGLELGETTINVKVTSQDTNVTETYTVAVTRALNEILSATLTVGRPSSGGLGFLQGLFGSLSDKTFSFDGTNYTITELAWRPGNELLTLETNHSFNQKARDLLVLKFDNASLNFTDASGSGRDRNWSIQESPWSVNNRVSISIATPALPSVPADLGATAISIDQIDLLWQPPDDDGDTDITGYRIEVSDDDGGTWTNLRSNTRSVDTTYSHTAVPPGTTIHYRVSAINGLGIGPPSDVAYATTDAGTEVWSPTVTVGLISSNTYPPLSSDETFGYSASDSIDSISDATFTIGGTEYTVEVVSSYGLTTGGSLAIRQISLDIDEALPTDATIAWYLPGESYRLEDATVDEDTNRYSFIVDADSQALAWSAGDTVSMSLAIATPDPTLSGLSVNDGTNDLTLNPAFSSTTYNYAARLHIDFSTVTLNATVKHPRAAVTSVTLAGTGITDANFADGITVPSLVVGDNEIIVTVTAEDEATTQAYTVTVTRAAPTAPSAPTNLRATADGASTINLAWRAPADNGGATISGYKIQHSPNGNSNWTNLVANTHTTNTTYSDTSLSTNTTRHYRAFAINSAGTGAASNVASATTADATVSFGPGSFTASENGATARVTVELSTPADVTIPFRVQHQGGASSADYSGVPRRLIFEDGKTIRVITVTAVDDSENDDDEKLRIEFGDLPAGVGVGARSAVTVKLKDNDGGNSLPRFDPANEIRNLVENTAANQNVGLPITATDADDDSLTYTFSGPDMDRFTFMSSTAQIRTRSGQTYDYETHQLFVVRVTADDGNGGIKTATVVIRIRDMAEPPSTPSRLTTLQVNPTSMVVSWTPPNNTGRPEIADYDIQFRKSSETDWTAGPQAVTDTNAALTGLEPSTRYYVQVRAKNAEGDSPWTSTLSRTTRSLSPGISITKTSLTVTEGSSTTYFIVLGSQPTATVRVSLSGYGSADVSINQNYHVFDTGDWNTPRAVKVTASEDADSRDKTVTIDHSVTTDDTDYAAITLPSLTVTIIDDDTPQVDGVWTQAGDRQLTVNWNAADHATGYKLQWRRPGESYDTHARLITITSGSTTTYTIPDLTNLSTYEVRVAATRTGQNDGPWSEEITGTPAATP